MDKILDRSKVRYFPPSRVDKAPYGTILYVDSEKDGLIIYIQLSEDPEEPNWVKGRNLLEIVFQELVINRDFIETCIKIFQNKDKTLYLRLSDIIKNKYGDTL
jgi:hypothetical protein